VVPGLSVLLLNDASQSATDVARVSSKIGIFPGSEKAHDRHSRDARTALPIRPTPIVLLRFDEKFQTAVVHLTHVARDCIAGADLGKLCVPGPGQREKQTEKQTRKLH